MDKSGYDQADIDIEKNRIMRLQCGDINVPARCEGAEYLMAPFFKASI